VKHGSEKLPDEYWGRTGLDELGQEGASTICTRSMVSGPDSLWNPIETVGTILGAAPLTAWLLQTS
jgi:hypothetical protein